MTIAQSGFIKGVLLVVVAAVVAYVSDPAHLTFLSAGAALIVSGIASSLESYLKSASGNSSALFGAVKLK